MLASAFASGAQGADSQDQVAADGRGRRLMPATVIVGLQWGDEGKGKTTDFLAEQVAMVVRYQGGDNAGHTVVSGDEVFKLRLTPSGVLYPHITSVIGNGVVVNPLTLIDELDMLTARGIDVSRVRVSRSAHVIMPYHVALDQANEARLGGAKVGTTGRGIGPTYGDRAWRLGLRMEDLLDPAVLRERIERALPDKNLILAGMGKATFEVDPLVDEAAAWGSRLRDHLDDTTWLVQAALARGEHVLLEGAQGTLLDLDHGSYPYVTSSNPVAGGACTGGGIGPLQVDEVIGVMKAYSTRVGSGPYPTELHDEIGAGIAERGHEFGTVTGRPRRVGWFDAVPLRYAVAVNSVSSIMLNKLDILSGIETIRLCVAYELDGRRVEVWPSSGAALSRAIPIYEAVPRLVRADPRHPVAGRPAGERPPLRVGDRGTRGRADRARLGRAGADPDDRAGVAPDAPPAEPAGMSLVMPTRVLVVGGGGREHALAWKLAAEPGVNEVVVAPGSAGIAEEPRVRCLDVPALAIGAIVDLARAQASELVVVGPEAPLEAGLADALSEARVPVFGASRAAAAVEWSKAFCHEVAAAAGVRMARAVVCTSRAEAARALTQAAAAGSGVVVKEDGLAAGKGVTVFDPGGDPSALLDDLYARDPAARIVIEERLYGPEASVIAVCDGERAIALPAARDHKRLADGDLGPNTGGMGAYSPLPDLTDPDVESVLAGVHRPILAELARRGTPFRGFLYAGLMLTTDGPVLLECNARLGDPETQVTLPRLGGALGPLLLAAARGALPVDLPGRLPVLPGAAVGVVLAGEGYPAGPSRGAPITGIDEARRRGGLVFHAGTAVTDDGWATNGGRILTVVGRAVDLAAARAVADRAADAIAFPGLQRRHDIGAVAPGVEVLAR